MVRLIIDPVFRGMNDHHWSHVEALIDYQRDKASKVVVAVPVDFPSIARDDFEIQRVFSRPPLSSYNEYDFPDYLRFMHWYAQQLAPQLTALLKATKGPMELLVPNGTTPVLFSLLVALKEVDTVVCIRAFLPHVLIRDCGLLGILTQCAIVKQLKSQNSNSVVGFTATKSLHDVLKERYELVVGGILGIPFSNVFGPSAFPPMAISSGSFEIGNSQFDIVFVGYLSLEKNALRSLMPLLDRGVTVCLCIPQTCENRSVEEITDLYADHKRSKKLTILKYDQLDNSSYVRMLDLGRFVYLISANRYYSSRKFYSMRLLECLTIGKPVIANEDSFGLVPFLDVTKEAILIADERELQQTQFCDKLVAAIVSGSAAISARAVERREFWRMTIAKNSFESAVFRDLVTTR